MKKLLFLLLILGVFSSCTSNTEDVELTQQVDSLVKYQHTLNRYEEFKIKAEVFEQLRYQYDIKTTADSIPVPIKVEYIRLGEQMTDSLNLYNHLADKLVSVED